MIITSHKNNFTTFAIRGPPPLCYTYRMENTQFKLGKKSPSNRDSLSFGDFLTAIPASPLVDFAPNYVYPMFGNNIWGDCVCADEGHSEQVTLGLLTGKQPVITINEIETWYKTQNPTWSPTSGAEGNGMDIQTFLEYLVEQKKVLGFAKIDFKNVKLFQAAIYIGLSVKVGVQLQEIQQGAQFTEGLWDYIPGSPIIGGHDICFVGYNESTQRYQLVSWGKLIECTQSFVDNCVDEAWLPIRPEHIANPAFRNSFNLSGFSMAVSELTGGKVIIPTTVQRILKLTSPMMTGDDVKTLQNDLHIVADGIFGLQTKEAVESFQAAHSLMVDGVVGPATWQALTSGIPAPTKLDLWCQAATKMEDADPSLNNPGNIRFVIGTWMAKLAVGEKNGFCVFKDYATGYAVLKQFFTNAATGKSEIYHPTDTLIQFYEKYAPSSDNNNPIAYASFVASFIGVPDTTIISTLI